MFGVSVVSALLPFEAPDPPVPSVVNAMQRYWATFAERGDPNRDGSMPWPRYARDPDPHLRIAAPLEARAALAHAECDLWDELWAMSAGQASGP